MTKIRVAGYENVWRTSKILSWLYNSSGACAVICAEQENVQADGVDILIFPIDLNQSIIETVHFDILIINALKEQGEHRALLKKLSSLVTVLNADDKEILKALAEKATRIVSFGFNSKTCVTASSVSDNQIVFCIQRAFKTFLNHTIEQQEFSVQIDGVTEAEEVLSAVTAALIDDIPISFLQDVVVQI